MQAYPLVSNACRYYTETVSDYRRDTSLFSNPLECLGMTFWVWSDRPIVYEVIQNSLISLGKAPHPHLCHPEARFSG